MYRYIGVERYRGFLPLRKAVMMMTGGVEKWVDGR